MKEFKPPKGQRVCLQYFRTKPNGTKEILAIVTETNQPGSFSLFMPDGTSWKKTKTSKDPNFDKEVFAPDVSKKTQAH